MKNQQKLLVRLSIAFAVLFFGTKSFAQLKVGTNPTQIHKSSILELEADRQGFLLPRLTDTAAINSLNPPDGMLIYFNPNNTTGKGLYIRKAGVWQRFTTDSISLDKWSKQGDVLAGNEKLGSLNAQTLKIITNNLERVLVDGSTGDVTINNSASVGNTLTVADTASTKSLIVTDSVDFQNLSRSTELTEVLVIDTAAGGSVRRRTIATDAFKNWVVGNFKNTANANGLERITGATADTLVLHAATATTPGGVSTETQNFGGNKTFVDSVTASKTLLIGNTGTANSALEVQGSVALSIRTVTSSTTLANNDYTVLVDASGGTVTLTLPTPSAAINGRTYIIKKIGGGLSNDVVLSGPIEDGSSMSIYNDWTVVKIQTNGSRWYVIK